MSSPLRITTPDLIPEVQEALIQAGCTIEIFPTYSIVQFPEGTICEEIYPRAMNERYHVTLPDGRVLLERYSRYMEANLLFLPREMMQQREKEDKKAKSMLSLFFAFCQNYFKQRSFPLSSPKQ